MNAGTYGPIKHKTIFLLALALIIVTQVLPVWGDSSKLTIANVKADFGDDSQVAIAISGTGDLSASEPKFYGNPSRLVYDFPSTVLTFNNGRTFSIDINRSSLESVAIAQFQTNPHITRIVFRFNTGDEKSCLNALNASISDNKLVFNYKPGESTPVKKPDPVQKPEKPDQIQDGQPKVGQPQVGQPQVGQPQVEETLRSQNDLGTINVLKHKIIDDKCDCFVIEASEELFPSAVKQDTENVNLTFKNLQFRFPGNAKFSNTFSVPIDGSLVEKVRMINRAGEVLMSIRLKENVTSLLIEYRLVSLSDNKLRIEIITVPVKDVDSKKEIQEDKSILPGLFQLPQPDKKRKSEIMQTDASLSKYHNSKPVYKATIKGIRYVPIANGERFIFDVEGDFKPRISRLNYPSRLSIDVSDASVIMPKFADNKYRVHIDGALAHEMRVYVKDDIHNPGSVIQFYYNIAPTERLKYELYESGAKGTYHIDVFQPTETEHSDVPEFSQIPQSFEPGFQSTKPQKTQQVIDENQFVSFVVDDKTKAVQVSDTDTSPEKEQSEALRIIEVVDIPIVDEDPIEPMEKPIIEKPSPIEIEKPVEIEKQNTAPFGSVNFPANQMFSSDIPLENLESVPMMVIVLFNKETSSTHLYILTSSKGQLKWQHLKT